MALKPILISPKRTALLTRSLLAVLWVLAMAFLMIDPLNLERQQFGLFGLFLVVGMVAALRPAELAGGQVLDLSGGVVMAALVALGTGPGMGLAGLTSFLAQLRLRQPPVEIMYGLSARIVAAGAAGAALPARLVALPDVLRLAEAILLYFFVSTVLVTARLALAQQRSLLDVFVEFFGGAGIPLLALGTVGALAGFLLEASPWGLGVLLAGMVTAAEAIRAHSRLQEKTQEVLELSILNAVTAHLGPDLSLVDGLRQALSVLVTHSRLDGAWIYLVQDGRLRLAAHHNLPEAFLSAHSAVDRSGCICGHARRRGQPVSRESLRHEGLPAAHFCTSRAMGYHLAIPLSSGERVLGIMSVYSRELGISPPQREILSALGVQLGALIERDRLEEETRRAVTHLASVVGSASDLIVSTDGQGSVLTWNPAAARILGYPEEEARGRPVADFFPAESAGQAEHLLEEVSRTGRMQSYVGDLVTKDGQRVPTSLTVAPMAGGDGSVSHFVVSGSDLRELRALEEQVIQASKMASLGLMAGGIAHEIRNPLSTVSVATQLIRDNPHDRQLFQEALERIGRSIGRMTQIVDGLLRFARPGETGWVRVNLNELVEDVLGLLSGLLENQGIRIQMHLDPDLPPVWGSAALLRQVLSNLVLNAQNAMPKGGEITARTRLDEAGRVAVTVRDTGKGIPAEHLERIFDPFFSTMPVGQGTGLGLSIAHRIVEQHQGAIRVQTREGRGTTFTVVLPVGQPRPAAVADPVGVPSVEEEHG